MDDDLLRELGLAMSEARRPAASTGAELDRIGAVIRAIAETAAGMPRA